MSIDAKTVAELRKLTGAGMMDAKKALTEADGDLEKAAEELRKQGIAKATKRSDREAQEGLVHAYIHAGGKVGALVKVNCETDFVARNEEFKELCNDLAMQVAAADPEYMNPDNVPEDVVAKEKELFAEELKNEGKPEDIIKKIVEGKMEKFYSEVCLMKQTFIKDDSIIIEDLVKEKSGTIGEKIEVAGFCRMNVSGSDVACGM